MATEKAVQRRLQYELEKITDLQRIMSFAYDDTRARGGRQ